MLQPLASKGRTHADIITTISDIVVDIEVEEPRIITVIRITTPKQAEHNKEAPKTPHLLTP